MNFKNNIEDMVFEGFENDCKAKKFLIEKIQNLVDRLPYDSKYHVKFQKKRKEYFCAFKATSLNAVFFAIVSSQSSEGLQEKVESSIEKQILDWYKFRNEKEEVPRVYDFKRFIPKRFTFFNKKRVQ